MPQHFAGCLKMLPFPRFYLHFLISNVLVPPAQNTWVFVPACLVERINDLNGPDQCPCDISTLVQDRLRAESADMPQKETFDHSLLTQSALSQIQTQMASLSPCLWSFGLGLLSNRTPSHRGQCHYQTPDATYLVSEALLMLVWGMCFSYTLGPLIPINHRFYATA